MAQKWSPEASIIGTTLARYKTNDVSWQNRGSKLKTDISYHLRLSEFRRFSELVFKQASIRFDMTRYDEIRLFIADRMRIFRMNLYEQYLQYLEDDPNNQEIDIVVERLSREKVAVGI